MTQALQAHEPSTHDAIGSLWLVANAGSGKTYQLTWRVIRLLLAGAQPEGIWCVTYTNAAASEMRARLLKVTKSLQYADDAALAEHLKPCGALPVSAFALARQLYTRLVDSPHGGVRFTTMHGLCQSLLAAFPLEAGVAPGFGLLEGQEQKKRLRQAVRRVLQGDVAENGAGASFLAAALAQLVQTASYDRVVELLEKALGQRQHWREAAAMPPDALRAHYLQAYGFGAADSAARLKSAFLAATPIDCAEAAHAFAQSGTAKLEVYALLLRQWGAGDATLRDALYADYMGVFLRADGEARALSSQWFGKKVLPHESAAANMLLREQARISEYMQQQRALACVQESAALLALASAALQLYQFQKQRDGLLDYDDLLEATHRLLTTDGIAPWVMAKLDYRLEHLLVDEAQDTSPIQWQMISALIEEIIGQATGSAKTLFVVGDEKQSIYSFQGAAPWLLAEMKGRFHRMLAHSAAPLAEDTLGVSYRSSAAVLDVVNATCALPQVAAAFTAGAAPTHRLHHTNMSGRVEIWPLLEEEEPPQLAPYTLPTQYMVQQRGHRLLAAQVVRAVQEIIAEGAYHAGDVLVLVRRRSALVPAMIQALEEAGVHVAGADRLQLSAHIAVKDLMALMAWCFQPEDDVALAQLLRSPLLGASEETLFALAHGRGDASLWQRAASTEYGETLARWLALRHLEAYAFLQHVLEVDGAAQRFCARLGDEVLEVLDELLLLAMQQHGTRTAPLLPFLTLLRDDAPEIKRDSSQTESGKLRIMTVHGAKGLEAPVVLLVDSVQLPDLTKEPLMFSRDGLLLASLGEGSKGAAPLEALREEKRAQLLHEYYRLLYVAITRAAQRLVVMGLSPKKSKESAHWYQTLCDAMRQLPHHTDDAGRLVHATTGTDAPSASHAARASVLLPAWLFAPPGAEIHARMFSPSGLAADAGGTHSKGAAATHGHDPRAYGIALHALLQWVRPATPDGHIRRFLAGLDADNMADSLLADIKSLWGNAEIAALLTAPARCEQAVRGAIEIGGKSTIFSGSIDRLIEMPDCVWVLDYKTGANPPENVQKTPLSYVLQMKTYQALLAPLYPQKTVRAALLWTQAPRLDVLDGVIMATPWPPLEADDAPEPKVT